MTLTAAALLLTSALMHAGWNFVSKRETPSAAFFLSASFALAPLAIVLAVVYRDAYLAIPPRVWGMLVATGLCQTIYLAALAGAYRAGDMSVAYPIARSAPILIVLFQALALQRWDELTPGCFVGVTLTTAGCVLLPLHRFREVRLANYLNLTCALAVLAAIGTTGYTIIDDEALRALRDTPEFAAGPYERAVIYINAEYVTTTLWLALYVALVRRERIELRRVLRESARVATYTGVAIYATYALVLMSLAFVTNVSYAAAFRQASIPLGAILAIFVLREPLHPPKLAGVGLVTAGLILVALG